MSLRATQTVVDVSGPSAQRLLEIEDLSISFCTQGGSTSAVTNLDLSMGVGEVVGIVGESGSGKSVTAQAVMGLLPDTATVHGSVRFRGKELNGRPEKELREVRGAQIGMVFQEPMTALDPTVTVGSQLVETVRAHRRVKKSEAREMAAATLERVGIPNPRASLSIYPHELSGGMRQRAIIAIALICGPALIIADEPTTALDVTIQAQVLDLLRDLVDDDGVSVLLITHDLGVVARVCDRVVTLYAGEVVEQAPLAELIAAPRHPYTQGLLDSIPVIGGDPEALRGIRGRVPDDVDALQGCRFAERCPLVEDRCRQEPQVLAPVGTGRAARCWKAAVDVEVSR